MTHIRTVVNVSQLMVVLICSGMGRSCSKLFRRRDIVDLREDPLHFPIQCTDTDEHNDFIDLALDMFPVQCTQPS